MSFYILQEDVIRSFAHKGLKRLYEADDRSKLAADLVDRVATILAALDEAAMPDDLNRPSFRLHHVFRFDEGDAYEVDFLDYH